jgi:uncharacterized OB-fold protein
VTVPRSTPAGQPAPGGTDARPPKPRPAPAPDPDSAPYWAAALEGRLVVQHCEPCARFQLYGRDRCLVCRGPVAWVRARGTGTVYSYTVIHQNYQRPFRDWVPYVVALVDLDEGPRLMTNLVGCAPDEVSVGMPVRVRMETVSEWAAVPLFEPDR